MRELRWLTPEGIYDYYLNGAATKDQSPASIIGELQRRLSFERECFESSGAKTEDISLYESYTNPLLDMIKQAERVVYRSMITGAETGEWIALGKLHPDAKAEIIPRRYWPFLSLDIENRVATGSDKTYRAVFGLIARQIPKGHPFLEKIRIAQIISNSGSAPAVEPLPAPSPHPVAAKTGAPGRPSSMHYIRGELERRATAGSLEQSLTMEADLLVAWLKTTHPGAPAPTAKTVRNNISATYRAAKKPD